MKQPQETNYFFPVIDSILAPDALAKWVQERYGFEVTQGKILKKGINHSYLMANEEQQYVLRVYSYQWRSKEEIQEEISLLERLKNHGLAVSYAIADTTKGYIQELVAPEGLRYAVLFSFAKGEKIRELTINHAEEIGRLMAQIHQVNIGQNIARISYNATTLLKIPYQYALGYFAPELPDMAYIAQACEQLTALFEQADTSKIRQGIVHLDMWYDNMNIDENGKTTIFDFDFCGNGWLILDLAYTSMQLFQTTPDKAEAQRKINAFLAGYEALLPISAEEKRLLPYAGLAVWIFYLGVQSQRFNDWSNFFLSKNYLKHFMGMAKNWMDFNAIPSLGQQPTL